MLTVNVDLDGVLGDFKGRYFQVTGVHFDSIKDPQERWDLLKGHEVGFYKSISPFWGAASFVNDILLLDGIDHVRVLSALPSLLEFPTGTIEKVKWVSRIIHPYLETHVAEKSSDKHKWAKPGDILIDDNSWNIHQWNQAGGIGILHINFEKSLEQLKNVLSD